MPYVGEDERFSGVVLAVRKIIQMAADRASTGTEAQRRGSPEAAVPGVYARIDQAGRVTHAGGSLEITPASNAGYALTDKNDGDGTGSPIDMEPFHRRDGPALDRAQGALLACALSRRSAPDCVMVDKACEGAGARSKEQRATSNEQRSALGRQTWGATGSGYLLPDNQDSAVEIRLDPFRRSNR